MNGIMVGDVSRLTAGLMVPGNPEEVLLRNQWETYLLAHCPAWRQINQEEWRQNG